MSTLKSKKLRYALILTISFLFCAGAITSMLIELAQNKVNFTTSFGKEQSMLVEQVARESRDILNSNGTDNDVIKKVLETAETSGTRYWFLLKENEILYFKNSYENDQLENKDIREAIRSYKAANGYNVDTLSSLLDKRTNGTVLFSKSKNEEKILTSLYFFNANQTRYVVGLCTTEDYILTSGKIVKHYTYSVLVIVLVCLILFSVCILGTILLHRKNEEILINKKTIRSKNIKIEELSGASPKTETMFDDKTKLYGKEVFNAMMDKADRPELLPYCVLFIRLEESDDITYDDQIVELSGVIHDLLPKNSVLARVNEDELSLVLFKTEFSKAKTLEKRLLKRWANILKKLHISVTTNIYTQSPNQVKPQDKVKFWDPMGQAAPLIRYLLYSIFVTVLDVAIVWILYRPLHMNILIANTLGVVTGFIVHYLLASKTVFDTEYGVNGFTIYLGTFLLGLAMADWLIYFGRYYLFSALQIDISFLLSKGLSIVIPFFSLYYLRKLLFGLYKKVSLRG